MESNLFGDNSFEIDFLSPSEIAQSLSLDDVKRFLESLGVEQIEENQSRGYLICPTICHNSLEEEASMKLYWYQNHHCFRCFTECNEAMSIFELYKRFMHLNYYDVSSEDALEYVKQFMSGNVFVPQANRTESFDEEKEKYLFHDAAQPLTEYSSTVLDCFSDYHHPSWKKEGISDETMTAFHIKFWPLRNTIIIPHYDINERLIGIRGRLLNPEDIQTYGKYHPIQIGNKLYTHQLQHNLYGLNWHKAAIQKRHVAIIVESEKSVMLDHTFYNDWGVAVACCGSFFNKYQISLLTDVLGANEIIVALDKEYQSGHNDKAQAYRKKLETLCLPHRYKASFSYIWDYDNLLNEKDSPYDRGKEIFEYLYKHRVKVR